MSLQTKVLRLEKEIQLIKDKADFFENLELVNIDNESPYQKITRSIQKKISKSSHSGQLFKELVETEVYKCKYKLSKLRHKVKILKDEIDWNNQPKEVKEDFNTDVTFYKANTLCYWLILGSAALNLLYLLNLLSVMQKNFWVGICILINIVFLLFLFTSAIKIKNYKKSFNLPVLIFGIYTILRITVVLPFLVQLNYKEIGNSFYVISISSILISIMCIIAFFISNRLIKNQEQFINDGKIQLKHLSK